MEIERKYLVKEIPVLDGVEKKKIEQGYLCRGPVVRIRKSNEDYILTYKSKLGLSQEHAIQNREVELPLTKEAYEHLKEKTDGSLIQKTRYLLPLEEGRTAELDVFEGSLSGLAFVEVEFPSEEAAMQFVPPVWFGEDVSAFHSFSNGYLSEVQDYEAWLQAWEIEKNDFLLKK